MNIDKIIKLGIESKLLHESETKEYISECGVEVWISGQRGLDALEKFAELIAQHEREACAKIAETPIGEYDVIVVCGGDPTTPKIPMYLTNQDVAKAIRARGQA